MFSVKLIAMYWPLWRNTKKSPYSQVDDLFDVVNWANKLLQYKEVLPTMSYHNGKTKDNRRWRDYLLSEKLEINSWHLGIEE